MNRHLLFFYGTLMSGGSRRSVLMNRPTNVGVIDLARPVARGTIRGDLYAVSASGGFPCLVDGPGLVRGEVWECPTAAHLRAALSITDAIEGYHEDRPESSMYLRVEVELEGVSQTLGDVPLLYPGLKVMTYRWNEGRHALGPKIESGDWAAWAQGEGVAA